MRQHIVLRVTHDKFVSLLLNEGELVCMLKKQHLVLTFVVKTKVKNGKCNIKLPNQKNMELLFLKY